jgi:hypothetical protein
MKLTASQKLLEAARKVLRVAGWTPSRFAKWKECPQKVLLEDLMHLCPTCFRGKVSFEGKCDTCPAPPPEREALDRGNRLDAALTADLAASPTVVKTQNVVGTQHEDLEEATQHPKIAALVKKLRKTKGVVPQAEIVLDKGWTPSPKGKFTKGAWARLKLDVLVVSAKFLQIIDWKSGNIDKKTAQIREKDEYHESMRMYQAAALSTHPQAEARVEMAFLDADERYVVEPFKKLPVLKRVDLRDAQQAIERKVEPMLSDTRFAPRPGYFCTWCAYAKSKNGPCQFG